MFAQPFSWVRLALSEIDDRLHDARPTGASTMAVVPFTCDHFSVPSQEGIRCDQGMKFVQDLTSKSVRFSGESTALGIGEANASPTQALREHAVLFLEIRDHVQLMAVDPPGEYHEQQLERLKRWERCSKYTGWHLKDTNPYKKPGRDQSKHRYVLFEVYCYQVEGRRNVKPVNSI